MQDVLWRDKANKTKLLRCFELAVMIAFAVYQQARLLLITGLISVATAIVKLASMANSNSALHEPMYTIQKQEKQQFD